MEDLIPPEPDDSHTKVSTLRLRFPDGSTHQRRFLPSHTVGNLLNFVGSKGYQSEEYKLLTSFPKKDVSLVHVHVHVYVCINYMLAGTPVFSCTCSTCTLFIIN